MEEFGLSLIISLFATLVSFFVNTIIFAPLLLLVSWNIEEKYSASFWARAIVFGQVVFWGSFFWLARNDSYEAERFIGNGIGFMLNCVLVVLATAVNMRICMKIRDMIKGKDVTTDPDRDGVDRLLKAGSSAKDFLDKTSK